MMIGSRSSRALFSIFVIGVFAGASVGVQAQRREKPKSRDRPQSKVEETAQVVEVQVPVNVTFRDGSPVRGLTVEDFRVFDEGRLQTVTDFEVVDLEVVEPKVGRVGEEAIPAAARRHLLLLFDLSFSDPVSIHKARVAAREIVLNSLHPTDLASVATFSLESGPRLLVTFTPDRPQLARAIDQLGNPNPLHAGKVDPLRFIIEPSPSTATSASSGLLGSTAATAAAGVSLRVISENIDRMEKSYDRGKISTWSSSLSEMARMLGSLDGRKHVIYFSEGFDGRLMLGRKPSGDDPELTQDQRDLQLGNFWMVDTDDIYGDGGLRNDVGHMLEQFRRAGCVIQAVDIAGLTAGSAREERIRQVGQDVLFYLADETGGELFADGNRLEEQLAEVLERSTVTYLLSFVPASLVADGSYHRLKVKADLPRGARLAHREGYYSPRGFRELHPLEKSLLASDAIASAAPRRDLEIEVLAAAFRAHESQAYVPVIIEIGGEGLLQGHRDDDLSVELYTYVTNSKGEMSAFFTQLVSLDISRGRKALLAGGLKYYGHVDLEPGEYLVRVLVRNATNGRTGVVTVPVSVPDYGLELPVLLPPLFLESPGQWVLVREEQEPNQGRVVYPFTVNGEPYVPAARPVLRSNREERLCLVTYNLGESLPVLQGRVVGADGQEVDAPGLRLVERTVTGIPGLDKLLTTFDPRRLAAGDYDLRVQLTDSTSGATLTSTLPFSVVD